MEQDQPFNGCEGKYTYKCKDVDNAFDKLVEVEKIMDFFKSQNEEYDYETSMIFAPDGRVLIELNIFK
jgi:hypothetical protein